jgi:hypothetical protein
MIGDRWYSDCDDSIIDMVASDELDMVEQGHATTFVHLFQARTRASLAEACMMWNTLRIRLEYESPHDAVAVATEGFGRWL